VMANKTGGACKKDLHEKAELAALAELAELGALRRQSIRRQTSALLM